MKLSQCRAAAYINLKNAEYNYNAVKACLGGGVKTLPVIKADAYGHGALPLARLYERLGAHMLCVAGIDEAISLRENEITLPILILGPTLPEYAPYLERYDICQAVHSTEYASALEKQIPDGGRLKIHIKADTGMRRVGFTRIEEMTALLDSKKLEVCGLFTHYAESDSPDSDFTEHQLVRYLEAEKRFNGQGILRHTANSAAVLCFPQTHFDAVRPGIVLYGSYPSSEVKRLYEKSHAPLKPLMSFTSHVSHIFEVEPGETIGYSRTFRAPKKMRVATVSAGYADGVPRALSNRGRVGVDGNMCDIVGNICMDQFMIDISAYNNIKLYDRVVIFGEGGPSCEEIAELCGTISYEIYCSVAKRVGREYIGG